jgi:glycosyltransferase involved in cell wall biosynthesis
MSKFTPKLYIDLTTAFQEYGRHPHGTTRVERSIVAAFAEAERPDIVFFAYSRSTNRFSLVSRLEAFALATAPTLAELRRELDPNWRRHPLAILARDAKRWLRPRIMNLLSRRPTDSAGQDIFEPGSMLLFPGELQRHDFRQLTRLKRKRHVDLAFVFFDLLYVLPDDDPRFHDPETGDLPGSDFMVREGKLILSISRYSADELRKHVARRGVAGPPIEVIRLASRLRAAGAEAAPVSDLMPGQFVLTVGDVVLRKNHALLVLVWKRLIAAGGAVPTLVVAGRIDEECHEMVLGSRTDEELRGRIIFMANVDDNALAWLYANCRFTVFPSHKEGFGLPVAESLDRGKVCIASSATSIPEAGQGLAIELDPTDDNSWFQAVRDFCQDDKLLAAKEVEIAGRFRPVTWADTVADILGAIEAVRNKR